MTPKKYVGSSSISNIEEGYRGSVASKEYSIIWNEEIRDNPHLFTIEVVSKHKTRKSALKAELQFQKKNEVMRSEHWFNKAEARVNGFFGMDVSGEKNPMYGKSRTGEKHKGGENISTGLKQYYKSDRSVKHKLDSKKRLLENNPSKNLKIMQKIKDTWKSNQRNMGDKNPMWGKEGRLFGKKLYNNGAITKAFIEGQQPKGWVLGRHTIKFGKVKNFSQMV